MKKKEILILGSTGKLGCMLLKYCKKNHISILSATCFSNESLIKKKKKIITLKIFLLYQIQKKKKFIDYIKNKI